MSHDVNFYINKPSFSEDHPFRKLTSMRVKDYEARDLYKFIELLETSTQTTITSDPVNLHQVPEELKDKVKYEIYGWPINHTPETLPVLLGWFSAKPKYWSYVIGQVRKLRINNSQ